MAISLSDVSKLMVLKNSLDVPGLTGGGPWCPEPAAWAVATIISRNPVNAVTQILAVANENNKTLTICRSATSSQLKMGGDFSLHKTLSLK